MFFAGCNAIIKENTRGTRANVLWSLWCFLNLFSWGDWGKVTVKALGV